MLRRLVAFTRRNGHTGTIAERIVSARRHADCAVKLCDFARSRTVRRSSASGAITSLSDSLRCSVDTLGGSETSAKFVE